MIYKIKINPFYELVFSLYVNDLPLMKIVYVLK
jgi:hypothetical protein